VKSKKVCQLAWVLLLVAAFASAREAVEAPIFDMEAPFHPVVSRGGMVVSQERLASEVGSRILSEGGNAIDAAVATGFALAVTFPQAGNIGGGGFMLIHLARERRTVAVDYRELAPQAAHRDVFLDESGQVVTARSQFHLQAAGVPGTVAGLCHVLRSYGTMTLAQVLAPAIELARKGIVVTDTLVQALAWRAEQLRSDPASAGYFYHADGGALQVGEVWRQRDLAWSLKQIARHGEQAFYQGAVARKLVDAMVQGGGLITLDDLAGYRVVEREPVRGTYRGYDVVSMPPPSSGGVHLIQMLNMLETWDLAALEHNSAAYIHRVAAAMQRAYADRSRFLGDPDFVDVPVARLTDKRYAAALARSVDLNRSTPSAAIAPGILLPEESPQTTHFSVWDRHGNVVSNTYTLNFSFGSGISVPGAGFLLNNEMDDFSAKPGVPNAYGLLGAEANSVAPRKRPLSSMTPTIVLRGGQPLLATGSPGGSTIINVVLQEILNVIDFKMNVAEATAAPRFHHQWLPDSLILEPGISPDTRALLRQMGYQVAPMPRLLGKLQSIEARGGILFGSSDNRWPDSGVAVSQ